MWNNFKDKYESSLAGDWNYYNEKFGNVTWFFEEGAFIEITDNYNDYMSELFEFLLKFKIDDDLFSQLSDYQKLMLRKPYDKETTAIFNYSLFDYFENKTKGRPACLKKARTIITVTPKTNYSTVSDYAKETVWFGRRRGATIDGKNEIKQN